MSLQKILTMERINRNDYIALVSSLLGKGEAVVLTGHRRWPDSRLWNCGLFRQAVPLKLLISSLTAYLLLF